MINTAGRQGEQLCWSELRTRFSARTGHISQKADMACRFAPLSWRRGERGGAGGDRDPAALAGDDGVGDAQSSAAVGDGAGRDQLPALGARRAQEVHLEVQGGISGAGGGYRLDR